MGIKKYKPTTHSRRWTTVSSFEDITASKPYKPLTLPLKQKGGRNAQGRITVGHRGGGHKRRLRIIDFKRGKRDASGRAGDEILTSEKAEIKVGNCMQLRYIPLGTNIHNVELFKGRGGQAVRSAGSSAQILAKEGENAHIKMPSGEMRLIGLDCFAVIGQVSNVEHSAISIGKAGRSRWLGIRPHTRGVAMNPVDHPLGGGEGKSSGGRHPSTPWGKSTKGLKTRKKKRYSEKYILKRRPKRKKSKQK